MQPHGNEPPRRTFLKTLIYVAPAILTLQARPAFAQRGSGATPHNPKPKGNNGVGNGEDPQPPGNPPINDGPGTSPGNPGNQGGAHAGGGNGNGNNGNGNNGNGNGNGNNGKGKDGKSGTDLVLPPSLAFNPRQPIT